MNNRVVVSFLRFTLALFTTREALFFLSSSSRKKNRIIKSSSSKIKPPTPSFHNTLLFYSFPPCSKPLSFTTPPYSNLRFLHQPLFLCFSFFSLFFFFLLEQGAWERFLPGGLFFLFFHIIKLWPTF